jgi:hypothetical protein
MVTPLVTSSGRPNGGRCTRSGIACLALLSTLLFAIAASTPQASAVPPPGKGNDARAPKTMLPLKVGDIVTRNGEVFAVVKLGDTRQEVPLDLTTQFPPGADCPILDLALGPIELNLLGLVVETSPICLEIVADPGPGNLLGNLLCAVAHLLDDGIPLDVILDPNAGFFTPDEIDMILDGLVELLNGALQAVTAPDSIVGISDSLVGHCDILNLALGPIDLDLLGLVVHLDDCAGGPVTVDIFAVPGPGNLLGNLLCDLLGLLDGGIGGAPLIALLNQILDEILALI